MNRQVFGAACALALLLTAGCGESGGGAGTADNSGAAFVASANALSAKLDAATADAQVPGPDDAAVKDFDGHTARALDTLGTPALPVSGFESYEKLCGTTAKIVGAYVNVGVAQAPEAAKTEMMNRNAERYLDRMFTPLLFSAHCSAAHMPFLEKTVTAADLGGDKAAALRQVRDGAYGQVSGLLEMAGANDLDPARRRRIVDLLAADADDFAITFSAAQRRELAALSERVAATLPEESRGQAGKIKAGLEQAPCGKLCRM